MIDAIVITCDAIRMNLFSQSQCDVIAMSFSDAIKVITPFAIVRLESRPWTCFQLVEFPNHRANTARAASRSFPCNDESRSEIAAAVSGSTHSKMSEGVHTAHAVHDTT